jgi:DNA polymerase III delta prime subunit
MKNIIRNIEKEIVKKAEKNLSEKLSSQGLSINDLSYAQYQRELELEIELLTKDIKNIGTGIAIGSILTLFLGF